MKKLLQFIISILLSFGVKAQTFTPIHNYQAPDGLEVIKHLGIPYGTDTSDYLLPDSVKIAGIARKSASIFFQTTDSSFYVHWGKWIKVNVGGGSGSGIDSASYHTLTQAIDSSYATWNRPNGTSDTLEVWGDGFIPSGGGSGSTPSLQDVTDVGFFTTNSLIVTNNDNTVQVGAYSDGGSTGVALLTGGDIVPVPHIVFTKDGKEQGKILAENVSLFNGEGTGRIWQLPDSSGTIPLSVNGQFADVNGNIKSIDSTVTLTSGTITVSDTRVKTGARIFLSVNTPSGTQGFLSAKTSDIVDGTSFIINSTSAADDSEINYEIINP